MPAICSLSLLPLLSLASTCEVITVLRCEGASGYVSFTQFGRPARQAGRAVVTDNPPPGGRSTALMAETKMKKAPIGRKSVSLAMIGEREGHYGRRLDEKERCKAIVEQRITVGVTHSDVERALGKPDRVSGNNAETCYQYKADKRRGARSTSFDQGGYVKGEGRYRVERADPGN